ncbi:methyltransferase-domain-containing protein [Absidia repens]|uniref:Ribosomal RNA-processing protein 8 n=1 Tax=Absidia repens TaxID=90262 RepID=A0A1X2I8M0_9FUNG|nr:methyltransferase-domain-containing protein [Absidia repens]
MELFKTSGWSLPTNIAVDTKKKQNKDDASSTKVTKNADQLQAQFDQLGPKKDKHQKKRERQKNNKGDNDDSATAKKPKLDQSDTVTTSQQKQPKKKAQAKQAPSPTTKQHLRSNQDQDKPEQSAIPKKQKQDPKQSTKDNSEKEAKNIDRSPAKAGVASTENVKVNSKPNKKPLDASKKNKLKALLDKSKSTPAPAHAKKAPTPPVPASASAPTQAPTPKKSTKEVTPVIANKSEPGLTALQLKMKEKLSGARFRWLNEKLYTTEGNEAYSLFQEKPELFDEYHEGFRHQVESWPVNPVDLILDQLRKTPKGTVVADLGCGDAVIGHTLKKQKVLSYDLIAKNDKVIACDITKLPLSANTVDVVVFSLSLMGTNYLDFLKEAHRILKQGGEMKIAEVVSRFSDIDGFIDLVESIGFDFMEKDDDNKMFVMLYFTKTHEQDTTVDELDEEMLEGLSKTKASFTARCWRPDKPKQIAQEIPNPFEALSLQA